MVIFTIGPAWDMIAHDRPDKRDPLNRVVKSSNTNSQVGQQKLRKAQHGWWSMKHETDLIKHEA